jgi:uncharacterized membrane-anchored protein YjiN (DUF445 family)
MTSIPLSISAPREAASRQALRRSRTLATALLLFMFIVFLATSVVEAPGFAILLLRNAAEAGMVGGLADWFAVTALFRHPLGIPIPHTAILPNNKDRIGRALGRFVEDSFLVPAVLLPKLRASEPARHLAEWLSRPGAAAAVVRPVVGFLPQLIRGIEDPELQRFAGRALGKQLGEADFAPVLGRALRILATSGEADLLFERTADALVRWLQENRADIDDVVRQRSRWWVPDKINRRIATAILEGVIELLDRLRQPDSDARLRFRQGLTRLANDLVESPRHREQVEAVKARLLEHPEVQAWITSVWRELSRIVVDDLSRPNSTARKAMEKAVNSIGKALASDPATQARLDDLLENLAGRVIARRSEIGSFIAEVVRGWDARTVSDRLELVIGNDLQYIRMNGTVVGAFVGCVIFLAGQLF